MSFECAVRIEGQRCANPEPGGTTFLGSLTFCDFHQQAFEELVFSDQLLQEVTAARVARTEIGQILASFATSPKAPHVPASAMRDEATVYFFRCEDFIKIGYSASPHMRLRQIQSADGTKHPEGMNPSGAVLVKTMPGGYAQEQILHRNFKHLRHTGEWFHADPELIEFIHAIEETP